MSTANARQERTTNHETLTRVVEDFRRVVTNRANGFIAVAVDVDAAVTLLALLDEAARLRAVVQEQFGTVDPGTLRQMFRPSTDITVGLANGCTVYGCTCEDCR